MATGCTAKPSRWGMVLAAELSQRQGWLAAADVERVRDVLRRAGLPVSAPRIGAARALELMGMDKKVLAGRIRLVLLQGLGTRPSPAITTPRRLPRRCESTSRRARHERRGRQPGALCAARGALARPAVRGGRPAPPRRVPARPRSHRAFDRVPAPGLQDAGVRQPRGRPVPHAAHALAGGRADRAQRGARVAPERAADRGHLPRARSRAHAVRSRGAGRA